jgi:hypothetical protein
MGKAIINEIVLDSWQWYTKKLILLDLWAKDRKLLD